MARPKGSSQAAITVSHPRWRLYKEVVPELQGATVAQAASFAQCRYLDLNLLSRPKKPSAAPHWSNVSRPRPQSDPRNNRRRRLNRCSETRDSQTHASSTGSLGSTCSQQSKLSVQSGLSVTQARDFRRRHAMHRRRLHSMESHMKVSQPRRPKHVYNDKKGKMIKKLKWMQRQKDNKVIRERMTAIWNERTQTPKMPSDARRSKSRPHPMHKPIAQSGTKTQKRNKQPQLGSYDLSLALRRENIRRPPWNPTSSKALPLISGPSVDSQRQCTDRQIQLAVATYRHAQPIHQAKARATLPRIKNTWRWPSGLAEHAPAILSLYEAV